MQRVRSVQRPDAQALADAGNDFINDPAQIWGNLRLMTILLYLVIWA